MATKSKKMSATKSKATAHARANERAQGRQPTPRSAKTISQSRYPGETPLTGEDRPVDRPGGKQEGFREPLRNPQIKRSYHKDEPQFHAPVKKRRPTTRNREI